MNIETVTTVLIAAAPAIAAISAMIIGIVKMITALKNFIEQIMAMLKRSNEENTARLEAKTDKMEKAFKDMAVLKTKVESVEKYLLENKGAGRK